MTTPRLLSIPPRGGAACRIAGPARRRRWRRNLALLTLCAVLLGISPAAAQTATGAVLGTVADPSPGPLAGVTLTLSGLGRERITTSDAWGRFRFVGVAPGGAYRVRAALDGFAPLEVTGVVVRANGATELALTLAPGVEETITVTSERPELDQRELATGVRLDAAEIESLPTGSDPWSLLAQVPGVLLDADGVGALEFQTAGVSGGVDHSQGDFLVDGIQVNDPNLGASTRMYDLDQAGEVAIRTGGADVTKATPGISVHLVTKRGADELRGSARFVRLDANGVFGGALRQAQPNVDPGDLAPAQGEYLGKRARTVAEHGLEAGGPLVRERLWLWGSWAKENRSFENSTLADEMLEEHVALKVNAQPTERNSAVAMLDDASLIGENWDGSIFRPGPARWEWRGPSDLYRFEDTHVVSPSLFLSGVYAIQDAGIRLTARGGVGPEAPEASRGSDGVWRGNYLSGWFARAPYDEMQLDASYFFRSGAASHELRVGGRLRRFDDTEDFTWPGRNLFAYSTQSTGFLVAKRGVGAPSFSRYGTLWGQDTISLGRMTLSLGVRVDDQSAINRPHGVPANPAVPHVLPALDFPGDAAPLSWQDVQPRVAASVALGKERDTLVRGSFARFVDQLRVRTVRRLNPAGEAYAYFWVPPDTPIPEDFSQYDDPARVDFANGFDPRDAGALVSADRNDPGLRAPRTTELIAALEHAVRPELVLGLQLTARRIDRVLEEVDLVRELDTGTTRLARPEDYAQVGVLEGTIPGGAGYREPLFDLSGTVERTGGTFLVNGPRARRHRGASLTLTKRLAHGWMLRGYAHWDRTEWAVPEEYAAFDHPNRQAGDRDGDLFLPSSRPRDRGKRFLQATWSFHLAGLVQVYPERPWGFDLSGTVRGRQGYPLPYGGEVPTANDGIASVLVVDTVDAYRLDDVYLVDLRLGKQLSLNGPVRLSLSLDCFNVLNAGTGLARNADVTSSSVGFLTDNVAPRVYRLTFRMSWKGDGG